MRSRCRWLAAIVLAIASLPSCGRRRDPQTVLDQAIETLNRGDTTAALRQAEQGYGEFHKVGPDWAWEFTILRARVLYRQGMYEPALKVLSSEMTVPPTNDIAVRERWVEGLAYTSLHKFSDAERVFKETEPLCKSGSLRPCGFVSTARGTLDMERGRYADAQIFFERVLVSARESGDPLWIANSMLDLSWCADEQTHFDEAIDWASSAHAIAASQDFGNIALKTLGNMGWAYYKLGDPEKAEGMFVDAKNQAAKLGMEGSEAGWLAALGYVQMDAHRDSDAEKSFQDSLALARKINSREDIINSLIALAFLSEQTSHLDDAKRYADEALSMARADGNKRDETYPRLVQGRIAAQQHDAVAAQSALEEVADSADSPVFLKWEAQRSLARLYEDEHQLDGAAREYRAALSTFEAARAELQHENSRLPFLTNASRIYDDYIHFLVQEGKTAEALQVADYSRARTLSEGLGLLKKASLKKGPTFQPDSLNATQIARQVNGSILFYWLGEKQSYLWLITPKKTTLFPLPAASEIEPVVQRYRKALTGPQDPLATSNADGLALYRTLVAPARSLLPKDARVFIIPDGVLNTLNFETLLVPDPSPHYWIEDATIADANSLRLLAATRRASKNTGSLLLLGDAISPNPDYPELRKAAAEMEIIEKHFPATQQNIFAREKATPAAYLATKPEQFSYIHFVAHGTASRMSPLDSAIVLSRATAEDDSFKLYARDIIHRPLHADLVTISTCYGAGSRAYTGEGLVGLSWAFLRAGAHNVVGALWEVSDVSTPPLMDELYSGLKKGQRPEAALRAAKLSLLHSGNAFRKPFYWAPFQLYTGS